MHLEEGLDMIAGFALATRAWRKVSVPRVLAALAFVMVAEVAVGAMAAAMLGCDPRWWCRT